jgi:hypothetical protein
VNRSGNLSAGRVLRRTGSREDHGGDGRGLVVVSVVFQWTFA